MAIAHKYILLLLLLLLLSTTLGMAKTNTTGDSTIAQYKCPPCGCTSDKGIFKSPGICPSCQMTLIPVNTGFSERVDRHVSSFFRGSALTTIYTKILYPIFLAGIVFSLWFLIKGYSAKSLNSHLLGIILILSLYGFKNQIYGIGYQMTDNIKGLFTPISFISLLGPFIYFYTKSPLSNFQWQRKDWIHGLPALGLFFAYLIGFIIPVKNSVHFMHSPYEVLISHFEQILTVGLGFLYLYFTYRNQNSLTTNKALQNPSLQSWLRRFFWGMTLLLCIWALLIALNYWLYHFGVATVSNYPLWISIGLCLLWLGIEMSLHPQLVLYGIVPKEPSLPRKLLEDVDIYKNRLEDLMLQQKIYQDQDLNLEKVANGMDVNARHLSDFFNQVMGKNFYELVNYYRVEEVKRLLQDSQFSHLTIEAIAQQAGFKSKSTFNTAFKKLTHMTPRQFIKSKKRR